MIKSLSTSVRRFRQKLKRLYAQDPVTPGSLRLHLGCGDEYWPGWVNIDSNPDCVCDVYLNFTLVGEQYEYNSVSEIAMIHSLSYLRLWQARDLFVDLHHILMPDGVLLIELPDLSKCARWILGHEGNSFEYLEGVRGLYAFGIDDIEQKAMFIPYSFGWSGWHLRQELEKAGFRNVTILDPQFHGPRPWRDIRVEARK